ncbi:MAG: M1 family aminopeptidase [Cyclobacteriaceae bacterium]
MKSIFYSLLFTLLFISCQPAADLLDVGIPLKMAEYRKQQVSEVLYNLSFEIPAEKEKAIPAILKLTMKIGDLSQPLYLDFNEEADKIQSVTTNGKRIETDHRKEHVIIASEHLKKGENEVQIEFYAGELSLNRNEDFLYTLLVPDRASTLFPCFDQPDIKANYVLNITAPTDWKVICGAPEIEQVEKGNSIEHRFGKTEKMSTYLFSFVAGKFQVESQNPGSFDMKLLYRETNSEKKEASLNQIFKHHQQSIDFLEDYTGYPFPFQKLDFAAIPGFQYGGMEHVGAIQYRETSLFLDNSATESRKLGRGKLIAHETAHMWFGDLVTMKWFNDVWMKEVFANFMADKIVNPSFPEINHNLQFVTNHYPSAYSEDRTTGTNPIRQKLNNLKNAGTLYGRIIYNKAPIMMRQLEATMGKEAFQEGIQEYIKTYENGNAEWSHLVNILDAKTELNMKQWSDVWVNQSGRPILTDEISYGELDKITNFEVTQEAEDGSTKLWPQSFTIGMVYPDSVVQLPVKITGKKTIIEEARGLPKPMAIIYNYDGFGYGVFPTDEFSLNITPKVSNEVARGYSYINAYENVLNGNIKATEALQVMQEGLESEQNELIVGLMTNQIRNLFWKYLAKEDRNELQPNLEKQILALLRTDRPANIKKTLFRLYSSIAYSSTGIEQLYEIWDKRVVVKDLKLNTDDYANLAMNLCIYEHEKSEDIIDRTESSFENPDKKERFQYLIPSLSANESDRNEFFESLRNPENREKEAWVQTAVNNIHHPLRHTSSTKLLVTSLELLEEIQITGDIFFPKRWLVSTVGNYSSKEAHRIVEDFLAANPNLTPSLRNKLLQASDDLYRVRNLQK